MSEELFALSAETLVKLDLGRQAAAFDRAVRMAVQDCLDRPSDDRPRKITLQLAIKPVKQVIDNTISCEGATGVCQIRYRQPDWESDTLDFGVRTNGLLVFGADPKNHRQSMMDFEEEED
jgi:hypothetical protein